MVAPCPEDLLGVRSVARDLRRSVAGKGRRLTCVPCLQAKELLPSERDVPRFLAARSPDAMDGSARGDAILVSALCLGATFGSTGPLCRTVGASPAVQSVSAWMRSVYPFCTVCGDKPTCPSRIR